MVSMTISEQHQGSELRMRVGDELTVRLPAIPGTGYSWIVIGKDQGVFTETGEPTFEKSSEGRKVGAPEDQVFHFRISSSGIGQLRLEYRRPWDKTVTAAKVFSITLVAQE